MSEKSFLILTTALLILTVGGAVLQSGDPAVARTSASYNLEWHVIGGGQPVSSASYAINSTAGQGAASPPHSAGGDYVVSGGYWFGAGLTTGYSIYLPLVMRGYP